METRKFSEWPNQLSKIMNLGTPKSVEAIPNWCLDSDNDHPMRTPPTNSPPSSADERSPPASPQLHPRNFIAHLGPGVMMQVNDILAENDAEGNEPSGKKKREEREFIMAAKAENEKLLDKDWRDGTPRCVDFVDDSVVEKMAG